MIDEVDDDIELIFEDILDVIIVVCRGSVNLNYYVFIVILKVKILELFGCLFNLDMFVLK